MTARRRGGRGAPHPEIQLDMFGSSGRSSGPENMTWPPHERFPYSEPPRTVQQLIQQDLLNSAHPLLITGYAALEHLLPLLVQWRQTEERPFRLMIVHETSDTSRRSAHRSGSALPQEIASYWMKRGLPLQFCSALLKVQEMLESERLVVRCASDEQSPVDGRIYQGDDAITLGSSNYTLAGLTKRLGANVRFTPLEQERFTEAIQFAERIWCEGQEYTVLLNELLGKLLRVVPWQQALARACSELLEGEWAQQYVPLQLREDEQPLWPSQWQAIAQALYLIQNVGVVLIADPTGSGKTRLGSWLIRGLESLLWSTSRKRFGLPTLICPPAVRKPWRQELKRCLVAAEIHSQGQLSHPSSETHQECVTDILRAQVLAVDEAHNFLRSSARTRKLLGNMEDHVVLFTATPINRGTGDLLALIDLMGADNLDEEDLKVLKQIIPRHRRGARRPGHGKRLSTEDRKALQGVLSHFTVRRTKHDLNALVDQAPDRYRNRLGNLCRYPQHNAKLYDTEETPKDRELATRIQELARQLVGVTYFRQGFRMPRDWRRLEMTDAQYLDARLKGAPALIQYTIMARLRSSKAALLEHIHGTEWVVNNLLRGAAHIKHERSGNVLRRLQSIRGQLPKNELSVQLPFWLRDESAHRDACDKEASIYEEIAKVAEEISNAREMRKATLLVELLGRHKKVLAFDSLPITLYALEGILREHTCNVLLATGARKADRRRVQKSFSLEGEDSAMIGLCSDAMSEGLNLQKASAVVLLDLPSMVRVIEQRVGRVDRMDSPWPEIDVFWPNDSQQFTLRTDRRFFERHQLSADLFGSTLPLPDTSEHSLAQAATQNGVEAAPMARDQTTRDDITIDAQTMQAELAKRESQANELLDAFSPVRMLVSGQTAIVSEDVYAATITNRENSGNHNRLKPGGVNTVGSAKTLISLIRASKPWAFFAIAGGEHAAPKWAYFEQPRAYPIVRLDEIEKALRKHLSGEVVAAELTPASGQCMDEFLNQLSETERYLLPRRKRRVLDEMKHILTCYQERAFDQVQTHLYQRLSEILELLRPVHDRERPDLNTLAERWLELIRPEWLEQLKKRQPGRALRLKGLREPLKRTMISPERIDEAFQNLPMLPPLSERILVAIVGVPED